MLFEPCEGVWLSAIESVEKSDEESYTSAMRAIPVKVKAGRWGNLSKRKVLFSFYNVLLP